ncbi:HpcH/HpaI aldolase family protein [Terriglobus saanensis]|uniref:HpcH/HpaI aldolase n=1 Tax=Terriglobus saanensis (strain ATCC BAA-1853 / DSM 23119 / SP1PR4) TaxID=401053 RepID=E8V3H7_TERSS|nr:aldolase/citrate lyase family protein [Terriglobus saanensis]ADV83590.1 HpcH/HpaI aldolase [Terriglobus saanensis SP1PR4]
MNRLHRAIELAEGKPILGAAVYFYDPIFLEMAAHLGFKAIWIEMEHAAITFAEAADLCRMAAGSGMLTMIRIADTSRNNVLKAAECGPDMIDIPMADDVGSVEELVRYARFAPVGARGFFSVSRALKYGLVDDVPAEQQKLNEDLSLLAQIESKEALARIDEICAVEGVDIFIGPADLAASLGYPGQTSHPAVLEAASTIVRVARSHGKKIVTACGAADYIHWTRLGIDLLFATNDIVCLRTGAQLALKAAAEAIAQAAMEKVHSHHRVEVGEG